MEQQIIDWAKVRELRDEVGETGLAEVIELFLEEVELVLPVLGMPGRQLGDDMHFLKGCAANLGFAQLSALCAQGETCRDPETDNSALIGAVRRSYRDSRMAFLSQIGAGLAAG